MLKLKNALALSVVLAVAGVSAGAAAVKTYQVTGPVLSVTGETIVVQKGSDKWEIARDAATKVTGELAVGSQVTIQYRMVAASIDAKPAKTESKAPAKAGKKP
jgi:hypothetical protein